MFVFGVVATKGGVGKTTIAANLGGLLADIGYRVLLIDADVQPSLSRYFALSHHAAANARRLAARQQRGRRVIRYATRCANRCGWRARAHSRRVVEAI